jgi:hypothetical protein
MSYDAAIEKKYTKMKPRDFDYSLQYTQKNHF